MTLFLKKNIASWKSCRKLLAKGIVLQKAQGKSSLVEHGDSGYISDTCHKSVSSIIPSDKLFFSQSSYLAKAEVVTFSAFSKYKTACYFMYNIFQGLRFCKLWKMLTPGLKIEFQLWKWTTSSKFNNALYINSFTIKDVRHSWM